MSDHNLHSLLHDSPGHVASATVSGGQQASVPPPSDSVLRLDAWARLRGKQLVRDWLGMGVLMPEGDQSPVAGDMHELLFSPEPQWEEHPVDQQRAAWMRALAQSADYAALRVHTVLCAPLSAVVACSLAKGWWDYRRRLLEERQQQQQQQSADKPLSSHDQISRHARAAARAAINSVRQIEACGQIAGMEPGTLQQLTDHDLAQMFRQLRQSALLRAVIDMAGRATAIARSLQQAKLDAARVEIADIELGGDVARLLPIELTDLCGAAGEERELLAWHRIATSTAMCWSMQRRQPAGRGPIIVSVDESGSMADGSPQKIVVAKAIALAMAWVARHQRRWCCLVGWSCARSVHYVALPPANHSPNDILKWATEMRGGGTNTRGPLVQVPAWADELHAAGMPRGKVDHIIITDGDAEQEPGSVESYRAWTSREKVRTYVICVGGDVGAFRDVADRWWHENELTLTSTSATEVFSI